MGCAASAAADPGAASSTVQRPSEASKGPSRSRCSEDSPSGDKNAFIRSWVDATPTRTTSTTSRVSRRLSRVMSRAPSRARSNVSFHHVGGAPLLQDAQPRRPPRDFSDPAYDKLRRHTPLKDAYDVDTKADERGELGTFRLVVDHATSTPFMCRTVDKASLQAQEELEMLQAEVEAMHTLADFPGALSLHALYEDAEAFHLILDHCPAGDLFDRVLEEVSLPEPHAADIVAQILTITRYLHNEQHLLHRDISLENVFLVDAPPLMRPPDEDGCDGGGGGGGGGVGGAGSTFSATGRSTVVGSTVAGTEGVTVSAFGAGTSAVGTGGSAYAAANGNYKIKLGGFASCAFFKTGQQFSDIVGSSYYIAPEVLRRSHGQEADVWSVGVLLFMLLSGMPPFLGDNEMEIFTNVMSTSPDFTGDCWSSISQEAIDMVQQMLNFEPDLRPSPAQLLQHPWILRHTGNLTTVDSVC